jgi:tetratricopeptide (TPR) repeat protein
LTLDTELARAAFDDGATSRAAQYYGKALTRAFAMDDAAQIGNAAYNLALCQILLGQLDQAQATLADAGAAFRRSGSNPADVLLLEATVAQRQGRWEQALSLADQVLSASPDENHRFQALLLQAAVAYRQGDPTRAKTMLAGADTYRVTDPALLGARERLVGDILLQEGHPAEAAAELDRAAGLFQEAKHYRDMALTLQRAGQAYQQADDTARAQDRLGRAQRSLAAQGKQTP